MKRRMRTVLAHTSHQRGFTIVELLIVIVIIGILAALIVVTFNSIQERARNSQTTHAVEIFKKAFMSYAIEHNGTYPNVTGVNCIGAGYYNLSGGSDPECQAGDSGYIYPVDAEPNNTLKAYLGGKLPTPAASKVHDGTWVVKVGIQYLNQNILELNGQQHPWWLAYVLEGRDTKCPIGPVYEASGDWFNLDTPANRSEVYDNGVVCMTPLPKPSEL